MQSLNQGENMSDLDQVTVREIFNELKILRSGQEKINIQLAKHNVYIGLASAVCSVIAAILIKHF
jgi:hypothetical protein